MTGLPKPEPYRKVKARRKRAEQKVAAEVRAACVARDGYCILVMSQKFGPCAGASEWSHIERRSKTRGVRDPRRRHSTETSMMNCTRHHGMIERHEISVGVPVSDGGADRWVTFIDRRSNGDDLVIETIWRKVT